MKNILKLDNYYLPEHLEKRLTEFVNYYNNECYHESLNYQNPVDIYYGRDKIILEQRKDVKRKTLKSRKWEYQKCVILNN